jgi:hypothetical protein
MRPCACRGGRAPRSRLRPASPRLRRIDLAASLSRAGTEWIDDGASREERGLKHRAATEARSIPIPPVLVRISAPTSPATAPASMGACSAPHAAAR